MALKKGAPEKGESRRAESFSFVDTVRGADAWCAWCAGEVYWAKAHPAQTGTKPCLLWLTDNALPCVRCRPTNIAEWVGWLLVWREVDLRPCVVVFREGVRDLCEGLKYGDYIQLKREREKGSLCYPRKCLKLKPWTSKHPLRQGQVDPAATLLTMWKINELTDWYRCQSPLRIDPPREKVDASTVEQESSEQTVFPRDRLATLLEDSARKLDDSAERARRSAEFVRVAKDQGKNGKHKPGE